MIDLIVGGTMALLLVAVILVIKANLNKVDDDG